MLPHPSRRPFAALAAVTATLLLTAACSSGSSTDTAASAPGSAPAAADVSGDITVLTNRTDIVDTTFQEYAAKFKEQYPNVNVKFEAIKDYEGEVTTRMNTKDYGDVLLIPNTVNPADLPTFFEPLGSVDDLAQTYRFIKGEQNYDGQSYGIAITGNAQGFVYNKKVWEEAGITEMPTTPEEFLAALTAIKEKTDAVPLYTNYKDGWPLTQFEGLRGTPSGDPEAANNLANTDTPWAEGQEHFVIDSLLFDAVEQGLTEDDPTTTNWEQSKADLASGKIATMMLGSWAITQMQEKAADKADIGYLPFPTQANGKFHSTTGGDYKNAINVNSENKAAAMAWLKWFADESGYATSQGGLSPRLDGPAPDTLKDFEAAGVEYVELAPPPAGKESLVNDIDTEAEIGLWAPDYRQRIVDAARGASKETKQQIFDELNQKWAEARANVSS
jgi:ABC-type glycerol-3-phosphate transport system substrate-binding protein